MYSHSPCFSSSVSSKNSFSSSLSPVSNLYSVNGWEMSSYGRPTASPGGMTDNVHSFEDTTVPTDSTNPHSAMLVEIGSNVSELPTTSLGLSTNKDANSLETKTDSSTVSTVSTPFLTALLNGITLTKNSLEVTTEISKSTKPYSLTAFIPKTKAISTTTTTTSTTTTLFPKTTTYSIITTTAIPLPPPSGIDNSGTQPPSNLGDLCKNATRDCPDNAWCQVIEVGAPPTCNCKPGFIKFEQICLDIDECIVGSDNCNPLTSTCTNTIGGFKCTCLPGYTWNGLYCTDLDECDPSRPPVCGTKTGPGKCINEIGSYRCSCPSNYQLAKDNRTCIDIDECMTKTSGCSEYCTNLEGSFACSCQTGLKLSQDMKTCTAIRPCTSTLDCQYQCAQINGVDTCLCAAGYTMSSGICTDIDECSSGKNPCDETRGECINTPGSFSCSCKNGYTLGPNNTCNDRDGGWSAWGVWTPCDKSCQDGLKTRRRNCDNPSPDGLGMMCLGNESETLKCNSQDCPLTGEEANYGIPLYIKGLELSKFLKVNPVMLEVFAKALNSYCLANQINLRSCCGRPTDIIPLDNDTRTLIKWQNILAGSGFPKKVSELLIKTLLIIKFPKDNELCTGTMGKMRRRRAVGSSDPALSQQVVDASMTDSLFYNAQNALMKTVLLAFNQSKDIEVYQNERNKTAIPWWAILLIIIAIILLIILIVIIIICCCKCCKKKKRRVNPEDRESSKNTKHNREMVAMQKKRDKDREMEEKRRQKELEKQEKELEKQRQKELEERKRKEIAEQKQKSEEENKTHRRDSKDKWTNESPKGDRKRGYQSESRDQTSAHRNRPPPGSGHMQTYDDENVNNSASTHLPSASSRKGNRVSLSRGSLSSMFPDVDDDSPAVNSMPGNKFVIPTKVRPIAVKPPRSELNDPK